MDTDKLWDELHNIPAENIARNIADDLSPSSPPTIEELTKFRDLLLWELEYKRAEYYQDIEDGPDNYTYHPDQLNLWKSQIESLKFE